MSEPTEMELRVARAIFAAVAEDFDKLSGFVRMDALSQARAAIRAMREPTEEMVTAGFVAGNEADDPYGPGNHAVTAAPVWQAMIDAASPGDGS